MPFPFPTGSTVVVAVYEPQIATALPFGAETRLAKDIDAPLHRYLRTTLSAKGTTVCPWWCCRALWSVHCGQIVLSVVLPAVLPGLLLPLCCSCQAVVLSGLPPRLASPAGRVTSGADCSSEACEDASCGFGVALASASCSESETPWAASARSCNTASITNGGGVRSFSLSAFVAASAASP